jgi:hypothetical protein
MGQALGFLLEFFSSLRLTVALLGVLVAGCALGTFLAPASGFKLVWHAPWFLALQGLLALNLALCTARRLGRKRRPVGFLLLHVGVLVTLGGGLIGFLRMEKGMMIVPEGSAAREFWQDDAQTFPPEPGFRFRVQRGQVLRSGDVLAVAGGKQWTYTDASPALVVRFQGTGGEYIVNEKGRYVLMLRKVVGELPFSVILEKFWIDFHEPEQDPRVKLLIFADPSAQPDVRDPVEGLSGEVSGFRWRLERTTRSARVRESSEGPGRIVVSKEGEASEEIPVEEGAVVSLSRWGLGLRIVGVYRNARLEQREGKYHLVEEEGPGQNPAVALEADWGGEKEVLKLFAASLPSAHRMGSGAKARERGLRFAYHPPRHVLSVEEGTGPGETAFRMAVEGEGRRAEGWVVPGRRGGDFRPFPGEPLRFLAADMRRPMPRSYKAKVRIEREGETVRAALIEVNKPLRFDGYWLYQESYDEEGWTYTVLRVVRDPGVSVAFLGFFIIILGSFVLFYVEPARRWLGGRRADGG